MLAKVVTNYPPISSHMDSENRTEIFFWDISLFLSNWTNLSWLDKAYLKVHASSYIKYILCFPYTYICIQVENKCWLLCNVVYPFLKIRSLSWLVVYSITTTIQTSELVTFSWTTYLMRELILRLLGNCLHPCKYNTFTS